MERDAKGEIITKKDGAPVKVKHPADKGAAKKVQKVIIKADDGTKIEATSNVSKDKRYDTDCHGVTFGDGKYWINNDQVDKVIKGDKYKERKGDPKPGDVGVYRDAAGKVVHSVKVKSVDPKTKKVKVDGLGGLETKVHVDDSNKAWVDPNAKIKYYHK